METNLSLFLALVFVVTVWNTILLSILASVLSRWVEGTTWYHQVSSETIGTLKEQAEKAQSASVRLAAWSQGARHRVLDAENDFYRVEAWVQYGLAKLDFNVERASKEVDTATKRVSATVSEPLYRAATVIQGVRALLELLTLGKRDGNDGTKS